MMRIDPTDVIVPETQFWEVLFERLDEEEEDTQVLPEDPLADLGWREWLSRMIPAYDLYDYGEHHAKAWDAFWNIRPGVLPPAIIMPFPRKGGKSSSAEWMIWASILRGMRRYWIYVSDTQEMADEHVLAIAGLFELPTVEIYYPHHANRKVNKYGSAKAWRRNRLITEAGGVVDALGLDTARGRGLKFENMVADGVCLDDVDHKFDTRRKTLKKETTIRETILPAVQPTAAVLFAQNLIIPHGLLSRLVENRSEYLHSRITIGPIKAINDLVLDRIYDEAAQRMRNVIQSGTATWEGLDLEKCQALIDRNGLQSFLTEQQNEVKEREGALWTKNQINETRVSAAELPRDTEGRVSFQRVVVGVDPSGGKDEIGIVAAGLGFNGHVYILRDGSQPGPAGAANWGRMVVYIYQELTADAIVAEANFGGDLVKSNIRVHAEHAPVKMVTASRGKAVRAEPVQALYEEDLVHHVGAFPDLEDEMTSWIPEETTDSPNRLDALVWCVTELMLQPSVYTGGGKTIRINTR